MWVAIEGIRVSRGQGIPGTLLAKNVAGCTTSINAGSSRALAFGDAKLPRVSSGTAFLAGVPKRTVKGTLGLAEKKNSSVNVTSFTSSGFTWALLWFGFVVALQGKPVGRSGSFTSHQRAGPSNEPHQSSIHPPDRHLDDTYQYKGESQTFDLQGFWLQSHGPNLAPRIMNAEWHLERRVSYLRLDPSSARQSEYLPPSSKAKAAL
ncbi:hypothetical protein EDC04DRAFT_3085711 [Pisolithus marmoratus]|nr:hypothetical protein EDC04DRAFT_3085711 [Pisolithus marmoratus]